MKKLTREECESNIYSLLKEIDRTANILQCEEYRTTVSKNRCPLCDNLLDDDDDDEIVGCNLCIRATRPGVWGGEIMTEGEICRSYRQRIEQWLMK